MVDMTEEARQHARVVWNYMQLNQEVEQADVLLVLGSIDLSVAEYAAKLMLDDAAPVAVTSGGVAHANDLLATGWDGSEASVFAKRMVAMGVGPSAILLEEEAKNTGQNFTFTRAILEKHKIDCKRILVVTKPYMERRAYATGLKQWPEVRLQVTSSGGTFDDYCQDEHMEDRLVHIMVGDLDRIIVYPEKGFQVYQEVPGVVLQSLERLKQLGYTEHAIQ